ncbi:Panacea domain-containing protein [Marinifilum fragile]|uniref:Panacea domain-containing protein n=1 Tax=Marinifilum fragile TaxID=570161 RepID=UPI0006D1D6BE|nr:Panacea domain-containing protein [Marinifilum fragile]
MTPEIKKLNFEYFVSRLLEWYGEVYCDQSNDLSKIKVLKLLFFTSAVGANTESDGLLDIFDDFYAMPYGPVESEIYDSLGDLLRYRITKESTTSKNNIDFNNDSIEKARIDEAIEKLKRVNPQLIKMNPFDLVELSHMWSCWSMVYDYALNNNQYSHKIPNELIKAENKIFTLNQVSYEF